MREQSIRNCWFERTGLLHLGVDVVLLGVMVLDDAKKHC